jgi:hypothetical protein
MILARRILYFEDLSIGMTETLSKTIASSDVVGFAQLTGDRNPIHLSEHFAARTSFGRRIFFRLSTADRLLSKTGYHKPQFSARPRAYSLHSHSQQIRPRVHVVCCDCSRPLVALGRCPAMSAMMERIGG